MTTTRTTSGAPQRADRRLDGFTRAGVKWGRRLAAVAAIVGASAPTGLGGSQAYAVTERSDGDVVVTIHRLEDDDGLEQALADHGIVANVTYDPQIIGDTMMFGTEKIPPGVPLGAGCGSFDAIGIQQHGSDYVLTIPAWTIPLPHGEMLRLIVGEAIEGSDEPAVFTGVTSIDWPNCITVR
jgi:hypothetical protein